MIDEALAAVHRGQIIGLPTDTVYGVAAAPALRSAVEALFVVKGRPGVKPIPILCADLDQVRSIGILDDGSIVGSHWPGALTVVVRRVPGSPDWIGDPVADTVGVRVPDHHVALEVLRRAGPLAVTSANRSGDYPAVDHVGARAALGESVAVYLEGAGSGGQSSTVVDLTVSPPLVLRHGAVEWSSA